MKKIIFGLLAITTIGISCSKDGTTTPVTVDSYFNITAGNTWNYKQTANPNTTPVVTTYSLASLSVPDSAKGSTGKMYHVFSHSGAANEYYNVTGNSYYNFRALPALLGGSNVEDLYLKADAAVGDHWAQSPISITNSGYTATVIPTDTVIEKGISKTVHGITYNNVIHVSTGLSITSITPPLPPLVSVTITSNIQNYYAPKVGLIFSYTKASLAITGLPAQNTESQNELQSTNF